MHIASRACPGTSEHRADTHSLRSRPLEGKTIAILATDGVEQIELTRPREEPESAEAKVELVSIKSGSIDGYHWLDKADRFNVDKSVQEAAVEDYDALVLPGGVANPDTLRLDKDAVAMVARFVEEGKPVAAICRAPRLLIEAGVVRGKTLTSFPSLQTDTKNAGGYWVDRELCHEGGLITSRRQRIYPHLKLHNSSPFGGRRVNSS